MLRFSSQQIQRMRQQRKHRAKRTLRSRRASRQIHNQSLSGYSADSAAKRCKWSMLQPFSTHALGQPIHDPLAHQPGGVRGYVPGGQSCTSSGDDQLGISRIMPQRRNDCVYIVRQNSQQHAFKSGSFQYSGDGWTGDIRLLSPGAAIAYSNDNRTGIGRKSLIHPHSLRLERRRTQPSPTTKMRK